MRLSKRFTAFDIEQLSFKFEQDEDKDPRGDMWTFENDKFRIWIDAWGDVYLMRRNPDTYYIEVRADDLIDIKELLDWITEPETPNPKP